jgi:hypothetical protein
VTLAVTGIAYSGQVSSVRKFPFLNSIECCLPEVDGTYAG